MDRVADFESVGWGFESLVACHFYFWDIIGTKGLEPERA